MDGRFGVLPIVLPVGRVTRSRGHLSDVEARPGWMTARPETVTPGLTPRPSPATPPKHMLPFIRRIASFFRPDDGQLPYESRRTLLTDAEARFYKALCEAVGNRYRIAVKPRLADLVTCPDDLWRAGYGRAIAQKHVDFVLCDPADDRMLITMVVELDDRSHRRKRTRERDAFVDQVLRSCGIPIVRVPVATRYEARELVAALGTGGDRSACDQEKE